MKRQLPAWMLGGPIKSCDRDIDDGQAVKEPKQIKKRKQSIRDSLDDDIGCERVEKERKGSKNKRDQTSKIEEKAMECENKETVEPLNSVQGKPPRHTLVKCKERKVAKENVSSFGEATKNKRDQMAKIEEKARECENKETVDEPMLSVQGKPPRHSLVKCKERKVTKENVSSYGKENARDVSSTDCLDGEDDIDLTVEDLMIIANEYIREDNNNSKQVETSKEEHKSVSQSQGITDSRSPRGVHSVAYSSNVVDLTINGSSFDSENPTQSMLDLFLGPWLKKPQEEEKKSKSKTSDMDFEFETYKQKSVPVEKKPLTSISTTSTSTSTTTTAPSGKKKSSLKDKVSMFLD